MQNNALHAQSITERFTLLSKHAEKLAFPDYRKGIFEQRDISKWNRVARYIYGFGHPFSATDLDATWFLLLGGIIYFAQYITFVLGLTLLYPVLFNQAPFLPAVDIESKALLIVALIFGIPSSVISYAWWFEFLTNKKNPWWIRLALPITTFWLIKGIVRGMLATMTLSGFWESSDETLTTMFAFIVLLIPAVTYFVAILFDLTISALLVIRTVFGNVRSIHESRPIEIILKLVSEPIPTSKDTKSTWTLSNLPKSEISFFRKWAEANRDGSEKRTVPAFLIAAFIGVILTSEFIRGLVDNFLNWIVMGTWKSFTPTTTLPFGVNIPIIFMATLLLAFVTFVAKSLMALFRNIVAQNLIIESCIVAEQVIDEEQKLRRPSDSRIQLFFGALYALLFKQR